MALRKISSGRIVAQCPQSPTSGLLPFEPVGAPITGVSYGTAVKPGEAGLYRVEVTMPPGVSGRVKISSALGLYTPTSCAVYTVYFTAPAYVQVECDTPGSTVTLVLTRLTPL